MSAGSGLQYRDQHAPRLPGGALREHRREHPQPPRQPARPAWLLRLGARHRRRPAHLAVDAADHLQHLTRRVADPANESVGADVGQCLIRRLDARERAHVGVPGNALPNCAVSLAVHWPRDARSGCSGGAVMVGSPRSCINRQSTSSTSSTPWGLRMLPRPRTSRHQANTRLPVRLLSIARTGVNSP